MVFVSWIKFRLEFGCDGTNILKHHYVKLWQHLNQEISQFGSDLELKLYDVSLVIRYECLSPLEFKRIWTEGDIFISTQAFLWGYIFLKCVWVLARELSASKMQTHDVCAIALQC